MGIAHIKLAKYAVKDGLGMDVKLIASTLLQLPNGTRFVGVDNDPESLFIKIKFKHDLLKDGVEFDTFYHRFLSTKKVGDNYKITDVDVIGKCNLKECIVDEMEEKDNEG